MIHIVHNLTNARGHSKPFMLRLYPEEKALFLRAAAIDGYHELSPCTNPERGLVEVACWAHGRRHIYKALELDPARMGSVLAYIAQLYAVEKRARKFGIYGDALRLLREQTSARL